MQQAVDEDGFIWNVDAQGNPIGGPVGNVNQQQPARTQVRPADPTKQYAAPNAAADLRGQELANQQKAIELDNAQRGDLPKGYRWGANGIAELIPGVPMPAQSATAIAAEQKAEGENRRAQTIATLMGQVRQLYGQDIKGGWPNAISGRVPALMRPANEEFNAAANGILPLIRPLVAQSAKEGDSDKEMQVFMAYIPQSWDDDRTIERKMNMLETLIGGMTGGLPPSGVIRGIDEGEIQVPGGAPGSELKGYVGSDDGSYLGPNGPVDAPPPPTGGAGPASQRDTAMGGFDAMGRNFANAGTLGLADKFAAGANALLPIDNLFGADNRSVWDGSTFGQAYDANMGLQQQTNSADRQVNPVPSFAGDVGGSIVGMFGANAALRGIGAGGLVARTGGAAGDVAYGTARGGVEGGRDGALLGGTAALGGNIAGRYVLAPLATKVAGTRAGQAATQTVGRAGNAVANAGRGLFGRSPVPYRAAPVPAALSGGEKAAVARVPDDVTQQLSQAEAMGLPMALADTSPQLQTLGGSVVRKSPEAYALARDTLGNRALGQADRAQEQIARNFGPIDNPNEISAQLLQTARTRAAPLYDNYRAQPARTSEGLDAMLQTPAGKQALANARSIAANEGKQPDSLGFGMDGQGNVILTRTPEPATLDLVKRGLDDVLEGYRDPTSGRLNLNDQGRAVEGLRQRFVGEVDSLYPEYAAARQAYAGPAAEREALQTGRNMANANPRDIAPRMESMTPGQQDQFKLGQRVAMADTVDKVRYSSNPYQNIYGSPVAQQRAATVFGEEPAAAMKQAYDIEQTMGRTAYDTLGGSPTAMRAAADEAFDSPMGTAIDMGFAAATGGGGVSELGRKGANWLKDTYRLGASKKKADQLAPLLFNTNPAETKALIEALTKKSAARDVYVKRARKTGGIFGSSVGSAAAIPFIQ